MNIGLNITKNLSKFNHFLSMITEHTKDYKQCNFINASDTELLTKNISNLDIIYWQNIHSAHYKGNR